MKRHTLPAAAAVLLLAAAVAAVVRGSRSPVPAPFAPREPEAGPAEPVAPPPPSPEPGPVRTAARRGIEALLDALARQEAHRSTGAPLDPAVLQAREEEAAAAAADLGALLGGDPARWPEVFEILAPLKEIKAALRFGTLVAPFLDDAAEPRVLEGLRSGPGPAARRAAVAMLAQRESREVLQALLEAARVDPDSGVRYDALVEAGRRRDSAPSEELKVLIEETVRQRSLTEPDPYVRAQAERLLAGARPGGASPPRPPRRSTLRILRGAASPERDTPAPP